MITDLINQSGSIAVSASSAVQNFFYEAIVTSSATNKLILLTNTVAGTFFLAQSMGPSDTLLKGTLQAIGASIIYANAVSIFLISQLEILKFLSGQTDPVKLVSNLSTGFRYALNNKILDIAACSICFLGVADMSIKIFKFAHVESLKTRVAFYVLSGICLSGGYFILCSKLLELQQIDANLNAANSWHPPLSLLYGQGAISTNSTLV